LVYLNDGWEPAEGGALRTFPRPPPLSSAPVGADSGNLQVGWLDGSRPVFLDAWRPDFLSALYVRDAQGAEVVSARDFEVPRQPVDFGAFLNAGLRSRFEQISTTRLDPRFASPDAQPQNGVQGAGFSDVGGAFHQDVLPSAGTLVLFDSVSLPHLVLPVTGSRQRIAATGWFHEDQQAQPDLA
jgi:hypothetical protein